MPPATNTPTKPTVAPERSLNQRMDALERANKIRSARAQLKRDLKAGKVSIHQLLLKPPAYLETAKVFERILADEKNLHPNLDWPAGRLYHALGLEVPLYTPIFVMSRVTGWSAHVIEQAGNNRLIRPRARYTGPEARAVKPVSERG